MTSFYDFKKVDYLGNEHDFSEFKGKVVLVVNTATHCGFTNQYNGLQALYKKFKEQNFVILDFPCNQFLKQAPESSSEIAQICQTKFGVEFPIFEKIEVNGPNEDPLYTLLKEQQPEDNGGSEFKNLLLKIGFVFGKHKPNDIKWNFTKFLIDKNGNVVSRFAPTMKPEKLESFIKDLLQ